MIAYNKDVKYAVLDDKLFSTFSNLDHVLKAEHDDLCEKAAEKYTLIRREHIKNFKIIDDIKNGIFDEGSLTKFFFCGTQTTFRVVDDKIYFPKKVETWQDLVI
jgi:hypothetical protein